MTSTELLQKLLAGDDIRIRDGQIFRQAPSPLPVNFDFSRIEGMLLGVAIGDALGNSSEGFFPDARHERFGEVRDYLYNPRYHDRRGYPSDDTQLAFWTLEQLLADATSCLATGWRFSIG